MTNLATLRVVTGATFPLRAVGSTINPKKP